MKRLGDGRNAITGEQRPFRTQEQIAASLAERAATLVGVEAGSGKVAVAEVIALVPEAGVAPQVDAAMAPALELADVSPAFVS